MHPGADFRDSYFISYIIVHTAATTIIHHPRNNQNQAVVNNVINENLCTFE